MAFLKENLQRNLFQQTACSQQSHLWARPGTQLLSYIMNAIVLGESVYKKRICICVFFRITEEERVPKSKEWYIMIEEIVNITSDKV